MFRIEGEHPHHIFMFLPRLYATRSLPNTKAGRLCRPAVVLDRDIVANFVLFITVAYIIIYSRLLSPRVNPTEQVVTHILSSCFSVSHVSVKPPRFAIFVFENIEKIF